HLFPAGKFNVSLIGKDAGDSVDVKTPGGARSYEILTIRYV
ncbi:MAG TPA: GreA/GreB family elongation factor, partial [Tabrizicola sp.]|nr:GreA/GreB family elongation factor [Tabrizicola sp.]